MVRASFTAPAPRASTPSPVTEKWGPDPESSSSPRYVMVWPPARNFNRPARGDADASASCWMPGTQRATRTGSPSVCRRAGTGTGTNT
ncbi:hypothetical protein SMICM17S_01562 [Streptomyces microflavus]